MTETDSQAALDRRIGCTICSILMVVFLWNFGTRIPSFVRGAIHVWSMVGSAPSLESEGVDDRLHEYFREGNWDAVEYRLGKKLITRDVSSRLRNQIMERDGHQCIICGVKEPLEVDHVRALENGGDNDPNNLATLCRNCHGLKGKLDKSLRRKRRQRRGD